MKVVVNKMIGVISKKNIYPLLIEIANKKNTNVYWYKNDDINKGIERLKEKQCKIIITDLDYSKINGTEINFISLNIEPDNSKYIIDKKELVESVNNGNEEKVIEILESLKIPKEQEILILNPTLLFIKHIIEEKFTNKVITIEDLILNNIPVFKEETGEVFIIN